MKIPVTSFSDSVRSRCKIFNSQCKMVEVYFTAHALGYHKDFNIEKYFTKISKISYKFYMTDKKNLRNYHKS